MIHRIRESSQGQGSSRVILTNIKTTMSASVGLVSRTCRAGISSPQQVSELMQTARSISLPVIIHLIAVVPTCAFAQFNGSDSSQVLSASDASHRLLPADTQTLLRLREQTELLRALGLAPQNSNRLLNRNRPQPSTSSEPVSPQLLELLRQMAPQTLPEQPRGQRDGSQQRQQNGARSVPGLSEDCTDDQQRLRKLDELLKQGDLSTSDLRQLQELMQPSGANTTSRPFEPAGRAASDQLSGQAPVGESIRQSRKRPATGDFKSLPGNENSESQSGSDRSANSSTGNTGAADAHAERQEMLRRAFGIDPKSPSSVSSRSGISTDPNKNPDMSNTGRRQRSVRLNSDSDSSTHLNDLSGNSISDQSNAPGISIDDDSNRRRQTPRSGRDAEWNRNPSAASQNSNPNSLSAQQNRSGSDVASNERSKSLSEIAQSEQPAWQKLQRIAQMATRETNQRSSERTDDAEGGGFSLSNGLTRKLADVVQSAAEATAETVSDFRNGREMLGRGQSTMPNGQPEPRSEIRGWASSVNDWIASLPEDGADEPRPATAPIEGPAGSYSFGPATWLIGLLIGGAVWWLLRHRYGEDDLERSVPRKSTQLASNASERERLIYAFHELLRQSRCGSEEWWHHTRAVRQLVRQKPQLASAIQSLAAIYEQARYSPDSEPSPEQLAAARSALKQCGKR